MRAALGFFVTVAAAIVAAWWWLGLPAVMPAASSDPGAKLPCASYTPFRTASTFGEGTPAASAALIEADLTVLSRVTSCVRTYSTDLGVEQVPEIARRHGMTVLLGIWLGREQAKNKLEIDKAITLARQHPDVVRMIIVGNEVLLRGEMSPETLVGHIRDVKSRSAVPVTYADVWEFWLRHRIVADAVDVVTVHMLPYWEDIPIAADKAPAHVESIRKTVVDSFPGKDVLIGEVGWSSAGRMREGAIPSPIAAARFIQEVIANARRGNYRINIIEAFDQPWKRQSEGTVGGHWGIIAADGETIKFTFGEPVSNHPWWRAQAAGGVAFAAAVFLTGWAAGRRRIDRDSTGGWAAVAVMALAGGLLIGWTIEHVPLESLGVLGWTLSLVMAALAVTAPLVGAAATMRGVGMPGAAALLGTAPPPAQPIGRVLGVLAAILTVVMVAIALGLAFDPRYRDFPFAPLTAAAVPFIAITLLGRRAPRGLPETLAAAVLVPSALFVIWNEGVANWQSLWLCAVFLAFAVTLLARPGGRRTRS